MYSDKRILALITARGGSQRLPRKNLKPLGGKPLLAWTIEAAQGSRYIDRLIISSEDDEILRTAAHYGCEVPFVRPKALAAANTPSMDVICHALDTLDADHEYLLLLQPTSPFRTSTHIDDAIECCISNGFRMLVSIERLRKQPALMYWLNSDDRLIPILDDVRHGRVRDQTAMYAHNGAIYLSETRFLRQERSYHSREAVGYEMDGAANIDIDEPDDLEYANYLLDSGKVR